MAKPTIAQLFGTGTILVDDPTDFPATVTAANPALLIPMSALNAGLLNGTSYRDFSPPKRRANPT
jgi:hypothetical protein